MRTDWTTPLCILLCSLASLAFEVALTRIFSITLWYHFAFMIISIAMLGLAASGAALAIWPRLKALDRLGLYSLLLGIAIPVSSLLANLVPFDPVQLAWDNSQLLHIGLLCLILAVPFFCCGLVLATAFAVQSVRAPFLYGADLLGAGCGSLGILLLLSVWAPERAVLLLALAPLLAAGLAGNCLRYWAAALVGTGLSLLIFAWQPDFAAVRISPYKGLPSALRYPGAKALSSYAGPFARVDTFESPAVRFAPGLSLRWQAVLPRQAGLAVDGGDITAITNVADPQALGFLEHLPAALPYVIGKRERVLVLDPGGGLQLLMARRFAAGELVAVESRPELVRILRRDWRDFAGDLYPVRTATGLGRSWLRAGAERFDIIDIALTGVEPAGAYGIAEDFRFTVEAMKEYLGHLRPDGLLSVNLYLLPPPRTELRLLTTLVAAMEELGIREPARHLAVVRSWGTVCLLAKRSPLSADDLARISSFAAERWFDLVHPPGAAAGEGGRQLTAATDGYAPAVAALLDPLRRAGFLADYPFAVGPVRDDAPFFNYFLKSGRLGEVYRLMGGKWQFFLEAGGIVPAVLVQVALLSLLLVLLPLLAGQRSGRDGRRGRGLLPYFALLGGGFMCVETALIQRLILPLENPAFAVATVLAALLVSSGAGSLLSQSRPALQRPATAAGIAVLVILYSLALPAVSALLASWPLPLKLGAVFLWLCPLGLLLGIPFPSGLRLLGEREPRLLPWAWVINGCCSVLAPIMAIMLAIVAGFTAVLALGAAAYGLASLNLYLCLRTVRN
jgi:hypothetical protein